MVNSDMQETIYERLEAHQAMVETLDKELDESVKNLLNKINQNQKAVQKKLNKLLSKRKKKQRNEIKLPESQLQDLLLCQSKLVQITHHNEQDFISLYLEYLQLILQLDEETTE